MSLQHKEPILCHHRSPAPVLDSGSVDTHLRRLTGWAIENARLVKCYHFGDATAALAFVNRIGTTAEARNHHPIVRWWKRDVRIELWTHKSNGLTARDFEFAEGCDPLEEA